jgi:hypothetical protein
MSIDNVLNFLLNGFDFSSDKDDSEIYINKKFIRGENPSILKIILPPWGDGEPFITKFLMRKFNKSGYSCLAYFFPKYILSKNPKNTIKFFEVIKNQIKSDIQELKSQHGFSQIDIVAPSLGVVSACLIANQNNDIQNLFFIVPGSCLASSLWDGIRTQNLKEHYEQSDLDKEQLKILWHDLAPKNNVDFMVGKNIFIAISKADKVIPYRYGKELADLFKNLYPNNTKVVENSYLGHYLTAIKYYFFSKELLK